MIKKRKKEILLSDAIPENLFGFLALSDELSSFDLLCSALRFDDLGGGASFRRVIASNIVAVVILPNPPHFRAFNFRTKSPFPFLPYSCLLLCSRLVLAQQDFGFKRCVLRSRLDEFIYRTSFFPRKILIINLLIFITTNLILYTVIVFNSRRHSHHPNKKKRHWTQYISLFFNVDNILFIETIWCKKIQTN